MNSPEPRPPLRERLLALQSEEELARKMRKAMRRGHWTQEQIDYAKRKAWRVAYACGWATTHQP